MKTLATIMSVCVLAGFGLAGDDSPHISVVKAMLGAMDKITTQLKTVVDEDTAKAARPELKKAAEHWQALRQKAKDTPPPTKEEKARLSKEFASKIEDAQKKLFAEIGRVQLLPGGRDALQDLAKAFALSAKPTKEPSP